MRVRRIPLAFVAAPCLLVTACSLWQPKDVHVEDAPGTSESTPVNRQSVNERDGAEHTLSLDCASERFSSSDIDVIPPASAAEARAQGWPRTATEAAQATLEAPAFATDLKDLPLSEGVTVGLPGGATGIQHAVTNTAGETVAILTVQEIVRDAWATTAIESCA
jgi:hypothetical protein